MNPLLKALNQKSIDSCFTALRRDEVPLALATVVQAISPTSGRAGDKALVGADGIVEGWIGGGCAQPAVIEAARAAIESAEARLIRVGPRGEWAPLAGVEEFTSGCLSGGTLLIFVEPLVSQPALTVLGNSPAALALCRLAAEVGFAVTLAYPELETGNLPQSVQLATDFDGVDGEYVVVATQGRYDRDALRAALASPARHIAMIASARKIAGLKTSLAKAGVDAGRLARVRSPAGVDIGAVTPAEIALSVVAELVRVRRGLPAIGDAGTPAAAEQPDEIEVAADGGGCCGG